MQALYAHRVGGEPLPEAIFAQIERRGPHSESLQYVREMQAHLDGQTVALDARIDEAVQNRAPERVGAVERCILQLGLAEILHRDDVPVAVILDEAMELTRTFSAEESAGFVHGVLDRLAAARPSES